MTIQIDDMRAEALKVSGSETGSVTARNGSVASYVQKRMLRMEQIVEIQSMH